MFLILFLAACTLPPLPPLECHEQALNWSVARCTYPGARIEVVDDWAICRCPDLAPEDPSR